MPRHADDFFFRRCLLIFDALILIDAIFFDAVFRYLPLFAVFAFSFFACFSLFDILFLHFRYAVISLYFFFRLSAAMLATPFIDAFAAA